MINKKPFTVFTSLTVLGFMGLALFLSSFISEMQEVEASSFPTTQGKNFDIVQLDQITFQWISHYERVFDGNNWVNFIHSETIDTIQIETGSGSVSLDKNTCGYSYFKEGKININDVPLFTDSILPLSANTGTQNWSEITQLTGASCDASWNENTKTLTAKKEHAVGIMEYRFIFTSTGWKTELYVKNTSGVNSKDFGFVQTIDLNRDTVNFGGSVRNIDNFNNTVFDRTFLENNEAKVIDLLNGQKYDFDLAFQQLESITTYDTGVDSSKLSFSFTYNATNVTDQMELTLDPTLNPSISTEGFSRDKDNDNVCEDTGSTSYDSSTGVNTYGTTMNTGALEDCLRGFIEWDITGLDPAWTVNDIDIYLDTLTLYSAEDLDVHLITSQQPSTRTPAQIFDEINDDDLCADNHAIVSGANNIDLSACNGALEVQRDSVAWVGIGTLLDDEVLTGSIRGAQFEDSADPNPPVLTITYTIATAWNAGPPISPSATNDLVNQINFTWTPDNATGVIGYTVWNNSANSVNDWEWDDLAVTANFTDTDDFGFYLDTGLPECQTMWYKASAISLNNGTNSTSVRGVTAGCSLSLTSEIENLGDMFKVSGTVILNDVNLTSLTLQENGTVTDTNSTGQNVTGSATINYEFWERDEVGGPRNLTVSAFAQDTSWNDLVNQSKGVGTREYESTYQDAVVLSQGDYNYTENRDSAGTSSMLKVNRINVPSGETWPMECNYKSELFSSGTWYNSSVDEGWFNNTATTPATRNSYVTCYNDDVVFTFTSFGNKNATLAIVDFSDQLGTFAGVPLPFLFVILLASIFTGRSAVTGIIFLAITIGTMGVMGFLPDLNGDPAISGIVWSMIVFLTAIGVFMGKRYF